MKPNQEEKPFKYMTKPFDSSNDKEDSTTKPISIKEARELLSLP